MTYTLRDAHAITGLTFEPFCGEGDAVALHAVHVGRAAYNGVDPFCTLEDFPNFNVLKEFPRYRKSFAAVGSYGA